MILLVGSKGNMGQRYGCILRALGKKFYGVDYSDGWPVSGVDKVIIATPTETHWEEIHRAHRFYPQADILCEKPVVTSLKELESLRPAAGRLYCVNQYAHLIPMSYGGLADDTTYYNYFKHGSDGLAWDCFQIFARATDTKKVVLAEDSPVWTCKIEGNLYSIADMDGAYIEMLKDFLGPMQRVWGWDTIEETTRKVLQWISENSPSRE